MIEIEYTGPKVIEALVRELPEFEYKNTKNKILDRCSNKDSKYICCKENNMYAGFLVAYAINQNTYYNWIMGVLPKYREKGCASLMLNFFEKYAHSQGYRKCMVKTMNKYRNMFILLIKNGYEIVDVENNSMIILIKNI